MSVYVEVVLLNNLAVDALLVYAVLFLRRRKVRKLRFALAAAVGAAVFGGFSGMPHSGRIAGGAVLGPRL